MKIFIDGDFLVWRCGKAVEHTYRYVYTKQDGEDGHIASFDAMRPLNAWLSREGLTKEEVTITEVVEIEPLQNCLHLVSRYLTSILQTLKTYKVDVVSSNTFIFLSNDDVPNFRYNIFPDYKIQRKDTPKPKYYKEIKEFLTKQWNVRTVAHIEPDDALSILGHKYFKECVLVHVDKDIDQVKGLHYNPPKDKYYGIKEVTGYRNFLMQALVGDKSVDNIPGIKGVGLVTAKKILNGVTKEELWKQYKDYLKKEKIPVKDSLLTRELVYLLEEEDLEGMDLDMGTIGIDDI